ncbi:hypothetical protein C6B38_02730 [Spiroplasma sp. ChiS]|uniref:hypothetical protein n=1 Tax=Spiroplasma sp. ChiS TaxID=2099885 RepID=UPI000CF930C4|nr:hypothetical protein [Spiroplasma sp. ChiS]PQP79023.1 hypothetical protein C6B38_02730 [Spiroplasma sp. ChiS]
MKKLLSILGASVITTSGVAPLMAMSQYEPTTKESISSLAEIEISQEAKNKDLNIISFDLNINIHKVFNGTHTNEKYKIIETQLLKYTDYATSWDDFKTKYPQISTGEANIKLNAWNETKSLSIYSTSTKFLNFDSFVGLDIEIHGDSFVARQDLTAELKFRVDDKTETINWIVEWTAYSFAAATSMTLDFEVPVIIFKNF